MNHRGQVFISAPGVDGAPREVPRLKERAGIVEALVRDLAYPSGDNLYRVLRGVYYWPGLLSDCKEVANS